MRVRASLENVRPRSLQLALFRSLLRESALPLFLALPRAAMALMDAEHKEEVGIEARATLRSMPRG